MTTSAVVCDRADAAGDDADLGVGRLQNIGQQGLREEQRAERVDGKRPLQDVEVGGGETVLGEIGRNPWCRTMARVTPWPVLI